MSALLTLREVAALYRCNRETLRLQVLRGTARVMPCMGGGRGRLWLWRANDVEADIAQAALSDRRNRRPARARRQVEA